MKTKKIILVVSIFFYGIVSSAQCSNCNDSSNVIKYTGNGYFKATTAQAYFWEICYGAVSIVGSTINQTVKVNCLNSGNFKIKVTRFSQGNCIEACEVYRCANGNIVVGNSGGTCPQKNNLFYTNEGGGGLCTTGLASINGISNVKHVDWNWALGGHTGTINNAATTTPIYYPSGNWNNHYITICAKVYFNNGKSC